MKVRWLEHRIPPPLVGLITAVLMWWVSGLPALQWPGGLKGVAVVLLLLAGAAFDVAGLLSFRASRTTVNPLRPERASTLVTGGVYRLTRNPMYVGMACLLTAWALAVSSPLAWLGPLAYLAYLTRFQIIPEERVLLALFGEDYRAYMESVRRWL
jgi:protein-S-isoprenylcysteine O-methyltransferase Ste14